MREKLEAVIEELKRLKSEGVKSVFVAEDTLDELRDALKLPEQSSTLPQEALTDAQDSSGLASSQLLEARAVKKTARSNSNKKDMAGQIPDPTVFKIPSGDKKSRWNWLRERVLNCPECNRHLKPDKKVVFGVGNIGADIFFCGEAPGADEEIQGEPFVGRAGKLLNKIIEAMGLRREEVYIGNIMNWRPETSGPTGNRPPTREEINYCLPYLMAQLEIVAPKVIVLLGATAAKGLLGAEGESTMRELHGHWRDFQGVPLMVTYHPSYLLHNNSLRAKRMVWEDMLLVMEKAGMPISDNQREFFRSRA